MQFIFTFRIYSDKYYTKRLCQFEPSKQFTEKNLNKIHNEYLINK